MSENTPKTLADVQAGDEVVMVCRTSRKANGTSDDRMVRGVVIEAKRVNIVIDEKEGTRRWYMRRDTGTESTPKQQRYQAGGGAYGWKAYTVAEREALERRSAASRTLRKHGIMLDSLSPWRGREIELAGLLTEYVERAHSLARLFDWGNDEDKGRSDFTVVHYMNDDLLDACGSADRDGHLALTAVVEDVTCTPCGRIARSERGEISDSTT